MDMLRWRLCKGGYYEVICIDHIGSYEIILKVFQIAKKRLEGTGLPAYADRYGTGYLCQRSVEKRRL